MKKTKAKLPYQPPTISDPFSGRQSNLPPAIGTTGLPCASGPGNVGDCTDGLGASATCQPGGTASDCPGGTSPATGDCVPGIQAISCSAGTTPTTCVGGTGAAPNCTSGQDVSNNCLLGLSPTTTCTLGTGVVSCRNGNRPTGGWCYTGTQPEHCITGFGALTPCDNGAPG